MEKVSIIIPIYNTKEQYIDECISSIIEQTYKNIEIIMIDDGSKANIAKFCDKISHKDSRIKLYHKKNEGVSMARNFGIKRASGKWIFFADADDWLEKDAIYNLISKAEGMDIVIGNIYSNNISEKNCTESDERLLGTDELIDKTLLDNYDAHQYFGAVWGKLYDAGFIKKSKIKFVEDIKIGEDVLFNLEAYEKAVKIKKIVEFVYNYRKNEDSVTNKFSINNIVARDSFLKKANDKFKELNIKNKEMQYNFLVIRWLHRLCISTIFSKENKSSDNEKIEIIKNLVSDKIYQKAIKNIKLSMLSPRRKILVILLRLRWYFAIPYLY